MALIYYILFYQLPPSKIKKRYEMRSANFEFTDMTALLAEADALEKNIRFMTIRIICELTISTIIFLIIAYGTFITRELRYFGTFYIALLFIAIVNVLSWTMWVLYRSPRFFKMTINKMEDSIYEKDGAEGIVYRRLEFARYRSRLIARVARVIDISFSVQFMIYIMSALTLILYLFKGF
jgi:hypothetical protein